MTDVDQLVNGLGSLALQPSPTFEDFVVADGLEGRTEISRRARSENVHECITCRAAFADSGELDDHLNARNHRYPMSEIRARRREVFARLKKENSGREIPEPSNTNDEPVPQRASFYEQGGLTVSVPLKKTMLYLQIDHARLERFRRRRR